MKIAIFSLFILLPIVFQNCSGANFSPIDNFAGKRQASESDLSCSDGLCEDIGSDRTDEGLVSIDTNRDNEAERDGNKNDDQNNEEIDRNNNLDEDLMGDQANREEDIPSYSDVTDKENPITLIEQIFEVEGLKPVNPETCGELFTALEGMDMKGQDVRFNGNYQNVIVRNSGKIKINGNIRLLVIDGASKVTVNGNIGSLCIRAHHIKKVNGNLGSAHQVQLLIGQRLDESKAIADQISGNTRVATFIYDFDIDSINGNSHQLYIKNSATRRINGNVDILALEDSVLERLNGNVRRLLLNDSNILEVNGNIN